MEHTKEESQKPSLASGLAIIEKAQELRWTLQLAVAVLFADLVLVWCTGAGIIQWSPSATDLLSNVGALVTGVLAFGVLMSIVAPIVGETVRQLVCGLVLNIPWPDWMRSTQDYRRPVGKVFPSELLDHALRKGDKFLLDLYKAHQEEDASRASADVSTGQIAFKVLVLAVADYCPDFLGIHGTTVLQTLVGRLGKPGEALLLFGLLLGLTVLKWAWLPVEGPGWIHYPPLYDEIESERKRRNSF